MKAWFYRILRRTIVDLYRRSAAHRRAFDRLRQELEGPQSQEEERLLCACMDRLIPAMKPEYGELLRRVDLNDEATASVATSLGITRNNLTVRLHRARQQLRQHLEQTCGRCAKHGCLNCHCNESSWPRIIPRRR